MSCGRCWRCREGRGCIRGIRFDRTSLKPTGRFDPVVGEYVSSDREFRSKLAAGVEAQSEKLGMEAKVASVDPRDHDALSSLHGHDIEERKELAGRTRAARAG